MRKASANITDVGRRPSINPFTSYKTAPERNSHSTRKTESEKKLSLVFSYSLAFPTQSLRKAKVLSLYILDPIAKIQKRSSKSCGELADALHVLELSEGHGDLEDGAGHGAVVLAVHQPDQLALALVQRLDQHRAGTVGGADEAGVLLDAVLGEVGGDAGADEGLAALAGLGDEDEVAGGDDAGGAAGLRDLVDDLHVGAYLLQDLKGV